MDKARRRRIRNRSKTDERRLGKYFGVGRTPLSGGNSGHTRSDTLHPRLYLEAKGSEDMRLFSLFNKCREQTKTCPMLVLSEDQFGPVLLCINSMDLLRDDFATFTHNRNPMWAWSLFRDTEEKALVEKVAVDMGMLWKKVGDSKTPAIAVFQKSARGFLLVFKPEHRSILIQEKLHAEGLVRTDRGFESKETSEGRQEEKSFTKAKRKGFSRTV